MDGWMDGRGSELCCFRSMSFSPKATLISFRYGVGNWGVVLEMG
jgi:hypothetical protein